jgi:hypothetical protein
MADQQEVQASQAVQVSQAVKVSQELALPADHLKRVASCRQVRPNRPRILREGSTQPQK